MDVNKFYEKHNNEIDRIDFKNVFFRQATSNKYAIFACPSCGKPNRKFKVTSNYGYCDFCDIQYQSVNHRAADIEQHSKYDNFYADLKILY